MRYYELDVNGRVQGNYALPQPNKILHLIEEPPPEISFPIRDGVPGTKWIEDIVATSQQADEANRKARKRQDFIDNFPDWSTVKAEIEAIELAADALTQPTKGIIKDILRRLKKNANAINWLVNDSD